MDYTKEYSEKNEELQALGEEAKKRFRFYYENLEGLDGIDKVGLLGRIEEIFMKINFGFDYNQEGSAAYCDSENNIKIASSFWNYTREQQIEILLHEIGHAISGNNYQDDLVDSDYPDAYYCGFPTFKIIEEGLCEIQAELIMNYYYEHSDIELEGRINYNKYISGYHVDKQILKTLLLLMQTKEIDKKMLFQYFFGFKTAFFDEVRNIGGDRTFEEIKKSERLETTKNTQLVADEYFKYLEQIFLKETTKKSIDVYDLVYLRKNNLAGALRLSWYASEILNNFDIKNVDKKMIDEIYNQTNGLIENTIKYSRGYVSKSVEELINYWFNNCKREEFDYIIKLIPNLFEVSNYKYLFLIFKKYLNIDLNNLRKEQINVVISFFNKLQNNFHTFNELVTLNDREERLYDTLFAIIQQIYNFSDKEQLYKFNLYNNLFRSEKVLLFIKKTFGEKINLTSEKLNELIMEEEIIEDIRKYAESNIKKQMIETYIKNCSSDNIYDIIKLFPDAFEIENEYFYDYAICLGKIGNEVISAEENNLIK